MFTHAQKLERWLGAEQVELYSDMFRDWKGPPVAIAGVPGTVYAAAGGEFVGAIKGGGFANLIDFAQQRQRRIFRNWLNKERNKLNAGFSSLGDLISEATTGGKSQLLMYSKAPTTGTTAGNAVSA